MKIYRAKRNMIGFRGWIYEGTLLSIRFPELLPIPESMRNTHDWTYFWEEFDIKKEKW